MFVLALPVDFRSKRPIFFLCGPVLCTPASILSPHRIMFSHATVSATQVNLRHVAVVWRGSSHFCPFFVSSVMRLDFLLKPFRIIHLPQSSVHPRHTPGDSFPSDFQAMTLPSFPFLTELLPVAHAQQMWLCGGLCKQVFQDQRWKEQRLPLCFPLASSPLQPYIFL